VGAGAPRLSMSEIKPQTYKDDRPAEQFARFHERSRTRDPDWVYGAVYMLTAPIALIAYRMLPLEIGNVPTSGPVILAANHFSNFDHFLAGARLRRRIRFLAKSQVFGKSKFLGYVFSHGGVFPIRRGHADEVAFETIHAILRRGGCLMIYCEGGRSRTGELGRPRPGVGRAALESGAPVVPVAIHGSQGIRSFRRLVFPRVTIRYGRPMRFPVVESPTREQQREAAAEIFDQVRGMSEELAHDGRRTVARRIREEPDSSANAPRYS